MKGLPKGKKVCPKCGKVSLVIDEKTGRIYCSNCGYTEGFPVV